MSFSVLPVDVESVMVTCTCFTRRRFIQERCFAAAEKPERHNLPFFRCGLYRTVCQC